ncbi:EAL domain-containing protein [bacterium]|nr:MAG: EAL domain-containing protein [bacterium]
MNIVNGRRVAEDASSVRAGRLGRYARAVAISLLFVVAWNALDALKHSFAAVQPGVPPWYLPPALSLFVILTFGIGYAPLVFVAHAVSLIVDPVSPRHAGEVLLSGLVETLVCGGAGYLLKGPLRYDPLKRRISDVTNLVVVAGLVAPLGVAVASAFYAAVSGMIAWTQFPVAVGESWIGRAVGTTTILPLLMLRGTPLVLKLAGFPVAREVHIPSLPPPARLETVGQVAATALTLTFAYAASATGRETPNFLYLYFLPLAWIVVRRGLAGAIVVNAGTDIAAMLLSESFGYPAAAIADIQQFMLAVTLTSLLVGGIVSARARAERKLLVAQEQLARAEEASSTMILHVGLDARCRKAPSTYCALLGRTPDEARTMRLAEFVAPEDRPAVELALHRLIVGEAHAVDLQARFIDGAGHQLWLYLNMSVVRDVSGQPEFILVFAHDVTAQRLESEEVAYLAYHDALTGLPNRSMLEEHLTPALGRARRSGRAVAAVFVDLDGFKEINDTLGHAAGDNVLQVVASRLRRSARATDLVVRLAGDEFLMLITDIERIGLAEGGSGYAHVPLAVSANIHRSLEQPFETAGSEVLVSASVGISVFPSDAQDGETLIRHADEAMYLAKHAGTGQTQIFGESGGARARGEMLGARLFHAAERREFIVHYQPIVDLRAAWRDALHNGGFQLAGAIVGVEALLRWSDRGKLITPEAFLPFLESYGLIESVGSWANCEAIRQAALWMAAGRLRSFSINLSLAQLAQPEGAARLLATLRDARVDPRNVVVDVPESVTTEGHQRAERSVRELADAGVRIAVDHFGSGSSSIAAIRGLAAELVKIDRTLIARMNDDEDSASIVATLLGLAANLRMEAVAEGVESESQWLALIELGCPVGQGNLFSPPVPAEEMGRLLASVQMV